MTRASAWHRGRWAWREQPTAPELPTGFPLGRDRRAPSGMIGMVSPM
jgi:hypothetical protein